MIKCLRRGLVFSLGESNGCYCRGFLLFQVSRKIRTMILLDALTFFLIMWLNPWYLSEYLHLPFLLTHLTFLNTKVVFFFLKYDKVAFNSRDVRSQRAKVARNSKKSVGEGESCSRTRADIGIYCQY